MSDELDKYRRDGWHFSYDDGTQFVSADHANGRGKFSVCCLDSATIRGGVFRQACGRVMASALNGDAADEIDRLTTELATVKAAHVKLTGAASSLAGYAQTVNTDPLPKWQTRLNELIANVEAITGETK